MITKLVIIMQITMIIIMMIMIIAINNSMTGFRWFSKVLVLVPK